ncbi:polysaccharide biosynthesis protein [Vagococcus sp. PNs007]|uniref:Polysaccharide biosynthesis protein n=1 Tax=Vagococcus proximus TaxID=2991417 RepID=A0ABT5X447_9ENTE|nr:polysaccharide biosynthesis protein [Vagococcus proximus]MDF0480765.1 polysaccharide biosynthesis protein [Vagococcus proximus]
MLKTKQKAVVEGALLLTLTSFIVKILSAVYRVPFQNLVGDEGFYVYQQVYPIYGIAMTLGLSGLPILVSKMVAEQETHTKQEAVIRGLFPLYWVLSLILFVVFFLASSVLAQLMGDIKLAPVIEMAAIVFLLVPYLTTYRGYFQGKLEMEPTAYSQLFEQLVRVGMILAVAGLYTSANWTVYTMGRYAMSGAILGGVVALITLLLFKPNLKSIVIPSKLELYNSRKYLRRFLVEGGLICGYSSLLVIFQLIDSFLIKNALVAQGFSDQHSKIIKGSYDRGQPLIQVGMVIGIALTTAFLPMLIRYVTEKNEWAYRRTIALFVKVVMAVSSAASVGLIMLLPYLNGSLFGDNQESLSLSLLMGTVFFMSLVLMFQIIYQTKNQYRIPAYSLLVGCLVKIILGFLLTTKFGTVGASLATLCGLIGALVLLVSGLEAQTKKSVTNSVFIWKLLVALGMMIVSLTLYRWLTLSVFESTTSRFILFIQALVGVVIGGGVYVAFVFKMRMFTLREWLLLPKGNKIVRKVRNFSKK